MAIDTMPERSVRLYTPWALIEGALACPARMRTLDELNVTTEFLSVRRPVTLRRSWEVAEENLAIHKSSILFVHECGPSPPLDGGDFGRFARASVRLKIDDFTVHGFVHVPPGGSPLKRFENQRHPFVALTSALIAGDQIEVVVPFLAVNRLRVAAIQELRASTRAADSEDATDPAADAPRPVLLRDPG